MAADSEPDTSRTVVQTYVPAYQRDEWDEHADELGMSRSEFVKTMVQAGRRGFGADVDQSSPTDKTSTAGAGDATDLTDHVLETLSDNECLSWDELLAAVTGDVESRLEETLQELQSDDEIRYSGRKGGYVLDNQ